MTNVEQFKADCAEVYRQSFEHYDGDKTKAEEAVNWWIRGGVDRLIIEGREKP